MYYGFIVIYIMDFNTKKPIRNGELIIYKHNSFDIVYYKKLNTTFLGKTEKIKLEAPNKSLSDYPVKEGILPYSLYDIKVKVNGYIDSLIMGVQIFPDETAIQDILMMKLPNGVKQGEMTNIIVIPPNELV